VLFAGEVFPIKHLRALRVLLPRPRFFNLYGPTETNVCTFFELPQTIPEEQTEPFPIGRACSHYQIIVVDEHGEPVAPGREGELCARGPGVTQGYWNASEETDRVFLVDRSGQRWYRTGDIVVESEANGYTFRGRRDRMVKKRGYRVELGEIEAALYRHPVIKEAAVIAVSEGGLEVQIKAFLVHTGEKRPSIIEMKGFCAKNVPMYMVPDVFVFREEIPKTSTGKTNYQRLKEA